MSSPLTLPAAMVVFIFSGLSAFAQYPNPAIVHNGTESELLARAGNKLVMYDPYSKQLLTSDSTNITLLHDFQFSNNLPSLRDYQSTNNYLYMAGKLSPPGIYEYFIIYKTDGLTLDTLFTYRSTSSIGMPYGILASDNDTLYFLQRDSMMMADPQGAITNLGKVYGGNRIASWNNKIIVSEEDLTHLTIRVFDPQSQSFVAMVNLVDTYERNIYYYPVFNNWLLYCDSSLKYIDPVSLNENLIDSSLLYKEVVGILNNKIICFAEDKAGLYGVELYAVDISTHQPSLIKDINTGTTRSYQYDDVGLAVQATHLIYFYADDGVHGSELWVTDGTTAGTHQIVDYNPGSAGLSPSSSNYFAQHAGFRVNDYAYVVGDTLILGMYPYLTNVLSHFAVTNGTQFYIIDLTSNTSHEQVKYFTEFKGQVYFTTEITPAPWGHLCRFNSANVTGIASLFTHRQLEAFPNPSHNHLTIDLKQWYAEVSIKIVNTLGQEVATYSYNSISSATLDLHGDAGIYYLHVSAGNDTYVQKAIKY